MDIRHFIQNVMAVKLLWQLINKGEKRIPDTIATITTQYPSLHRDHGIAGVVRLLLPLQQRRHFYSGFIRGGMRVYDGAINCGQCLYFVYNG
jgi:hypothetical protein